MKADSLGLNQSLSRSATCQTVTPRSPALSSGQRKIAPPNSSSVTPRWSRYQAARAVRSVLDLKKTPPIPVTLAMLRSPIAKGPIVAACTGGRLAPGQADDAIAQGVHCRRSLASLASRDAPSAGAIERLDNDRDSLANPHAQGGEAVPATSRP